MREILFSAKSREDGEWAYGGYFTAKDYLSGETLHFIATKECESFPRGEFVDAIEIDPETLGQYAGMDDKNGVKIFEGDIVKVWNVLGEYVETSSVRWDDLYNGFHTKKNTLFGKNVMSYEVVGNIHDNPEMLGDADA